MRPVAAIPARKLREPAERRRFGSAEDSPARIEERVSITSVLKKLGKEIKNF